MRLGQVKVEVQGLTDDEEEREASSGSEGVALDDGDVGQGSTQSRAKREGNAEASTDQSHGGTALLVVANVGSNSHGQLDVALAQATDDATGEKGAEVCGGNPESNTEDVADHAP